MPLTHIIHRKATASHARGVQRKSKREKGKALLYRAARGTVQVMHTAMWAVGAPIKQLPAAGKAAWRLFDPGLLDRLQPPLTHHREA